MEKHILIRLAELQIFQYDVIEAILEGEIIEDYPADKPFSSCLFLKVIKNNPLHVVVSFDDLNQKAYIITAYNPSLDRFENDFKTRRK